MHTLDLSLTEEITKVEGAAVLDVQVKAGKIEKCRFGITEYKRFYTQAMQGKPWRGVPSLLARICGTCSNAHILAACKAVESALKITPSRQTQILRRLLINGLYIRDHALLKEELPGVDAVIHLACISNDPSYELDPALGKSINYDALVRVVDTAKDAGVRRFIYASSSSVYGVKVEESVTEDMTLEPLTDYSKYKALGEKYVLSQRSAGFAVLVLRPATVCGYSPRLRLDLSVNILTNHAVNKGRITVFGGGQKRPNIHIEDMADLYVRLVDELDDKIISQTFNAGAYNLSVMEIALHVQKFFRDFRAKEIEIEVKPTNDLRSYRVSSEKIKRELGWQAIFNIQDAVWSLVDAFENGKIPDPDDPKYYNIKTMQKLNIG